MNTKKCFKCEGFEHIIVDWPNRKEITLVEWEAMKEDEFEVKKEENPEEGEEEN